MSTQDMNDEQIAAEKSQTELEKLRAEVSKLVAETGQVKIQTLLAPFLAAAGVIGATAAVIKLFFS